MLGGASWIVIRATLYLIVSAAAGAFEPPTLTLGPLASLWLVAICSFLVVLDAVRRHERILLANLGVPLGAVALIGAIPALLAETMTSILALGGA